uniref:oligosaccharide flippase family protein n=1 Tax=uncultured Bifidobacterium sp. TaxID=165187 RepID=UPI00259A486E
MSPGLKHDVISSLFWRLVEQGGRQFVQLLVQIILARLLAPDMFGTLAVALVFVNLGNVIVT